MIKWSAVGETNWEIAEILSCSESTVNFHFNNVRRRFSVIVRK
ncbi:LuxR C-terminal-related transcriptional regulator [Halomonas huangheensis]